jgi:hypothetical protein
VQFHPEATDANVRVWAEHYRGSLDRLGVAPAVLLAETAERAGSARQRTHALVDRMLAHAGLRNDPTAPHGAERQPPWTAIW